MLFNRMEGGISLGEAQHLTSGGTGFDVLIRRVLADDPVHFVV